ncbi:RpiR family phosphosugar-binding transcriptional regulator [Lactobacillus pasteurii DSM 23907 = CRBIP 24.76]|uniref:Transcriptional regulator, RpiR family n=1 Tax=Lactobacillus pasteurii DSM 23907 = CRBIP 24.76 TaxID=1423790 RepID=I7IYJ1_9LACO|nr:MurR/RpiR family transcriptional regulator [Lactobacillus pasteurii]KRK07824.1 RpiR family phosphosugar-binding transcriptional regulator [Lactobacillus pasteurii DSM 23907 = CRBIP 24.76]TDG77453.1 hypothetical protein C5L33_000896 [Lactobacillus pasteurii]CCI84527.1 Transcriptional regulator, RpiR family [Lactobacillus pasteurii DSM 23907 = CRBIP 24.76]
MANKDLSNAELYLWNLVQNNPEKIAKMSIVALSQFSNVSTATIVRTMQKMGYSGYTAYRESLKLKEGAFSILNDVDDKIREVITKNEIEMNNTLHNLSYSTIEDSISMTKQASSIYLLARGFSEAIAKEMMIKLQLTGKYAQLHTDPNIIKTVAKNIRANEEVIFVSLNGETEELVEAARELNHNEVPILTFTTNRDSSLAKPSTLLFNGYISKTNYFPDYEVRSRLPLQIMTRIFADAYSVRTGFAKA